MPFAIRKLELVGLEVSLAEGRADDVVDGDFLAWFDADACDGFGTASWTDDPNRALLFATHEEAAVFWRTQSTVRPIRADGQPNRPLSAYTVSVEEIPEKP